MVPELRVTDVLCTVPILVSLFIAIVYIKSYKVFGFQDPFPLKAYRMSFQALPMTEPVGGASVYDFLK